MMRPDERANQEEIEREQRLRRGVGAASQGAAGLGTAAFGAGMASRILPFINEFIPADLAIKGISKISPSIGSFLKEGQKAGLDIEKGLQFVKDKLTPTGQEKNIIQQYSPELYQFIQDEINQGRSPLEAGALATLGKKGMPDFRKVISKMVKDHKTTWSGILQTVFEGGKATPSSQQTQQQPQQQQQQPSGQPSGGQDKWGEITKTLQDLLKS